MAKLFDLHIHTTKGSADSSLTPEELILEEITLRKPGNDEVLIEHIAIGLNYIDTYHRSGLYPLSLPSGIGMEASGIIKEVGPNVSNFSVGDKIAYAGQPRNHRHDKSGNLSDYEELCLLD